ncbi:MAG: 23S rRNA (guanosine(2251)-2'-O)-methyltransferase RlmB [Elusimicrobia bacterium GWA2_69_24]|nr:MAG: 23S rRNA (guanosine(2251)-2'-O)-methyltransferase RlmB [Elusimicrobia bacterium GWA2_69_24]HBL16516.1 23S rRNA (guanosine(2251)-2'-O)-methyltransferase RlmB [Elusimicrobiota bacterium]
MKKYTGAREEGRLIWGRHVVEEAVSASGSRVLTLWMHSGDKHALLPVAQAAQRSGTRIYWVAEKELDRLSHRGPHQGMVARVVGKVGLSLDSFIAGLSSGAKARAMIVALDQIQDPQNFGAIARSAVCLGATALLCQDRHTAPLSQAVLQASAGAAQKIPILRVVNLAQAILKLKEQGFWVYGADMGGQPAWKARLNRPLVLIIGSEGQGIRPLVRSTCDDVVAVPQSAGGVASLNASCAASVLLYEAARQYGSGG